MIASCILRSVCHGMLLSKPPPPHLTAPAAVLPSLSQMPPCVLAAGVRRAGRGPWASAIAPNSTPGDSTRRAALLQLKEAGYLAGEGGVPAAHVVKLINHLSCVFAPADGWNPNRQWRWSASHHASSAEQPL